MRATSIESGALMTGTPTSDPDRSGGVGTVDSSHLLLVGAGPGLGMAVARRFAVGGYRVTLVARSTDKLDALAGSSSDTGAEIGTIEADASDPEGLGARLTELYRGQGAPGVIIYNAVMGAPDQLLSASVDHLRAAYAVDVISAIVVAQVAARAMKAAGFGTMIVTGGIRRPSDPGPRDGLSRQSRSPVGRDDARGRLGAGRHTGGYAHDRRTDRCRYRL
jgi:NAD(P)-dependent dehydrogenase (short-subunit alcohol dehydrogenase family)